MFRSFLALVFVVTASLAGCDQKEADAHNYGLQFSQPVYAQQFVQAEAFAYSHALPVLQQYYAAPAVQNQRVYFPIVQKQRVYVEQYQPQQQFIVRERVRSKQVQPVQKVIVRERVQRQRVRVRSRGVRVRW